MEGGAKILADFNAEFKNFALMRERSERIPCAHNAEGFIWSSLLDIGRTFFIKKVQNKILRPKGKGQKRKGVGGREIFARSLSA